MTNYGTKSDDQLTSTRANALGPRVIELSVHCVSTVLEPTASASTAAGYARFLGSATLGTHVTATDGR